MGLGFTEDAIVSVFLSQGTMSMLKVSALLVAYAAVVLQTSSSSAAPAR